MVSGSGLTSRVLGNLTSEMACISSGIRHKNSIDGLSLCSHSCSYFERLKGVHQVTTCITNFEIGAYLMRRLP